MDESRGGSRIIYPKLFATLTEADLASQFRSQDANGLRNASTVSLPLVVSPTSMIVCSACGIAYSRL
jgi:hypothetical protein